MEESYLKRLKEEGWIFWSNESVTDLLKGRELKVNEEPGGEGTVSLDELLREVREKYQRLIPGKEVPLLVSLPGELFYGESRGLITIYRQEDGLR